MTMLQPIIDLLTYNPGGCALLAVIIIVTIIAVARDVASIPD
jgi:hypothetical protein